MTQAPTVEVVFDPDVEGGWEVDSQTTPVRVRIGPTVHERIPAQTLAVTLLSYTAGVSSDEYTRRMDQLLDEHGEQLRNQDADDEH